MNDDSKFVNLPKEIDEFCRNNPSKIVDNLYLCQSVDMDGNIIDTKIGVNKMTNYGLKLIFVNHNSFNKYIFLGSGKDSIDPTSSSLQSYISALGQGSITDSNTWRLAAEYDSQTHLFFCRNKLVTCMWEYTSGSNQEYEIWEIGCGGGSTSLVSHALIYDTEGNQTCIVKRPNTRLYVTLYWTNCVNVKRIQGVYDKGQYALIHPNFTFSYRNLYISCLVLRRNGSHDDPNISGKIGGQYKGSYYGTTQINATNLGIAETIDNGPGSNAWTWNENDFYTCGFLIGTDSWSMDSQDGLKSVDDFGLFTYNELPEEGFENVKHIECEDIYVNRSDTMLPYSNSSSTNINSANVLDIEFNFGKSPSNKWSSSYCFDGILPCAQFDISSLSLYNHLTKEWDIPVKFINAPDTYYNMSHRRLYLPLWINYNGSARTVYVFVNPYTNIPIKSFNNSGMSIVATDEYWDTSTYEPIDNLFLVPELLQSKRYYIVVSGTLAVLNPVYDRSDRPIHRINPDIKPYELTDGLCPKNVNLYSYDNVLGDRNGSNPISSDIFGYFLDDRHLVYVDNDKNVNYYEMDMGDGTNGCPVRRYQTINEDRIIMFHNRYCYNTSGSRIDFGYDIGKNKIRIFTISDKDTEPAFVDVSLTFSSSTNNSTYHKYTFSRNGFLVAQRREGVNEAVILDIYGDENGPIQYIVSNCKHCSALNLSDYCVYQDTNATTDTEFSFNIYDMKNQTILKSFVISNIGTYTIDGIWGWREFVFVNITDGSGTKLSYFYNIEEEVLQQSSKTYFTVHNTNIDWRYNFSQSIDECMVCCGIDYATYVLRSSDILNPIRLVSNAYCAGNENPNNTIRYIQIKRANEGKQIILSMITGPDGAGGLTGCTRCIDLGWILDNGPMKMISESGVVYTCQRTSSESYNAGSIYQLNNGVVVLDGNNRPATRLNRLYWIPLECMLRMKIIGETRQINSYNQPISFGDKKFSIQVTNDWDLMVDDEDKV